MSMAMQNEKEEHDFRKPTSQYLPPLSVIEEEASIEISF
jgi:hypothetical protein